jgi:hypothetical protein
MKKPILIVKTPKSYNSEKIYDFQTSLECNEMIKNDYYTFVLPNIEDVLDFKVFDNNYGEETYNKLKELIEELKK